MTPLTTPAKGFAFHESMIRQDAIRLKTAEKIHSGQTILAIVDGMEVGKLVLSADVPAQSELTLQCHYFPKAKLPCMIRFAIEGADEDAAPPLEIVSLDEILQLVPPAPLHDVKLHIAAGRLSGHGILSNNAMAQPNLICRINGLQMRAVKVDRSLPHASGGVTIFFSTKVEIADITDKGLRYDIISLPDMSEIASLSQSPISSEQAVQADLVTLHSKIVQLQKQVDFNKDNALRMIEDRHHNAMTLIDGFAQYMLAAVYDGVAGKPNEPKVNPAVIETFRRLAAEKVEEKAAEVLRLPPTKSVSLSLEEISRQHGWHGVEADPTGSKWVWMTAYALISNPWAQAPLSHLSLKVQGVLDESVLPIRVLFDGLPAEVELIRDDKNTPIRLNARFADGIARNVKMIELLAEEAVSPKSLGKSADDRILSILIKDMTLQYSF